MITTTMFISCTMSAKEIQKYTESTQNTTQVELDVSPDNQEHGKEVLVVLEVVQANQECPTLLFSVFI